MDIEITDACKKEINKQCRRNPTLKDALEKKIAEIMKNPEHFKPLRHSMSGERRVHILKSFVLIYEIHNGTIRFLKFEHHDTAYDMPT